MKFGRITALLLFFLLGSEATYYVRIGARNLPHADIRSKSDPYAKLTLDDVDIGTTSTVDNTLVADWPEHFAISESGKDLVVQIKDADTFTPNDSLGYAYIPVSDIACMRIGEEQVYTLFKKKNVKTTGEVVVMRVHAK